MDKKNRSAFTIIEVAVVLAIAGLILALVFVGVGQANKAGRDSKRKQDANYFATAIEQWAQNNNGQMPDPAKSPPDFTVDAATGVFDCASPLVAQKYVEVGQCDSPATSKFFDPLTEHQYKVVYSTSGDPTTGCPSTIDPTLGAELRMRQMSGREARIVMCLESGYFEVGQ